MSRDLTPTTLAAIDDDVVYPFFAVELQFDSEVLRMWTGQGTFNDGVDDWLGTGSLLEVSAIEECATSTLVFVERISLISCSQVTWIR